MSRKKNQTNHNKIIKNNGPITDNLGMANALNDFFVNIGTSIEKKIPATNKSFSDFLNDEFINRINLRPCTNEEIAYIIQQLNTGKSSGPFSIPTSLIKDYSLYLIPAITSIINKSLEEGVFPSILKSARVCPIYKKSDKTLCENYRPISLLSNLSKIFERVMFNRIEEFLSENYIMYQHQFGFRKKYSTNHALLSIIEQIKQHLDNKTFVCGIFVDLEKAFDTVNHKII